MDYFKTLTAASVLAAGLTATTSAVAVPALQLFIEGAVYCETCTGGYEDSWAKVGTTGLRLWVLAQAPAFDVHLVASYNQIAGNTPGLLLTPVKIGDAATAAGITRFDASAFPGFTDTLNADPVGSGTFEGNLGSLENNENKYDADDRDWVTIALGDMDDLETQGANLSPLEGFTGSGGTASGAKKYHLNVYDITFTQTALPGQVVNFGVWGCEANGCPAVLPKNPKPGDLAKVAYVNMPNSHDAQWLQVPTPGTGVLLLGGLSGIGWLRNFWRRKQAA